jgi:aquaporin Z
MQREFTPQHSELEFCELLASELLMAVIFVVVYTKGLRGFGGVAIGGIVGLDRFFLAFISGASMNPARSLAPAVLSSAMTNLWLYWIATFIGTSVVALILRRRFIHPIDSREKSYQDKIG